MGEVYRSAVGADRRASYHTWKKREVREVFVEQEITLQFYRGGRNTLGMLRDSKQYYGWGTGEGGNAEKG